MYIAVRKYEGATQLFDLLEQRESDVRLLIQDIPGFMAYYLARTETGGITVTVCNDRAGATESVRLAAEWVRQNAAGIPSSPPEVTEGEVKISFMGGGPAPAGAPLQESSGEAVVE